MAYVKVAAVSDIPDRGALRVEVGGREIAVACVDGEAYAFDDNCTHREFRLSWGGVDPAARTISCEWHGAQFCMRTGEPVCPPAFAPIAVYPAKVEDGAVWVDV